MTIKRLHIRYYRSEHIEIHHEYGPGRGRLIGDRVKTMTVNY